MMIPFLLFFLTIVILGGIVYLYLHKEQGKTLIPKDKYDEAWGEFYNQRKKSISKNSRRGNLIFYLPLVVLSAISASLIASLSLIAFQGDGGLGALFLLVFLQRVQWILVIPATVAVYFLYFVLSNKVSFYKINHLAQIGIPLIFNILGAGFIYILFFSTVHLHRLQSDASSSYIDNNVDFSIKNEALIPWSVPNPNMHYVAYQVTIYVKNDLQNEIPASFMLAHYNDPASHFAGIAPGTNPISQGESDIVVNMPILVHDLQCGGKPPYLFYYIDNEHSKSIAMVSNNINRELQQIACGFSP